MAIAAVRRRTGGADRAAGWPRTAQGGPGEALPAPLPSNSILQVKTQSQSPHTHTREKQEGLAKLINKSSVKFLRSRSLEEIIASLLYAQSCV